MPNNNINWLGNKVVDPTTTRQTIMSTVLNQSSTNEQVKGSITKDTASPMSPQPIQPLPDIINPPNQQGPPPATSIGYIPAYLMKNIGKNVRAEFIINNSNIDKTGRLIEVGINYFVLEDPNSRTNVMCDLYSVKFVTVLQS